AAARRTALAVLLAVWMVPPLFGLVLVQEEWGTRGLLVLVLLAKIGDVAGFFVGRAIGRRHPFPRLSPGKTVAGCVASLGAGLAAGLALAAAGVLAPGPGGLGRAALGGIAVNLAAQAGDLAESAVKRSAGVKDSSRLVGPSGGVLDVVDSLLLAVPAALLLFPLLLS
ncbi:MAG: phosphatidate cytidylyltransferase, partial [Planctomycetota bacterium]